MREISLSLLFLCPQEALSSSAGGHAIDANTHANGHPDHPFVLNFSSIPTSFPITTLPVPLFVTDMLVSDAGTFAVFISPHASDRAVDAIRSLVISFHFTPTDGGGLIAATIAIDTSSMEAPGPGMVLAWCRFNEDSGGVGVPRRRA